MLASPGKIEENPLVSGKTDVKKDNSNVIKTMAPGPPNLPSSPPSSPANAHAEALVHELDVDSNLALRPNSTIKAAYLTWFGKVFPEFAAATASVALMTAAMRPAFVVQPLTSHEIETLVRAKDLERRGELGVEDVRKLRKLEKQERELARLEAQERKLELLHQFLRDKDVTKLKVKFRSRQGAALEYLEKETVVENPSKKEKKVKNVKKNKNIKDEKERQEG